MAWPVDWRIVTEVLKNPPPDFVCASSGDLMGLKAKAQVQVQAILTDPDLGGEVVVRAEVPLHLPNQAVYLPGGQEVAVPPAPKPPNGLRPEEQVAWVIQAQRLAVMEILRRAQRYKWATVKWQRRHGHEVEHGLDAPIGEDADGPTLHEGIAGPASDEIEAILDRLALQERLERLALTQQERRVALLLADGLSQAEVADVLGVTPGRVAQLVAALRGKLRPF